MSIRTWLATLLAGLVLLTLSACGGRGEISKAPIPTAIAATPTATPLPPTSGPSPTPVPTPDPEKVVLPQPEDWVRGPEDALVTFIEWSDFQCPYCAALAPLMKRLLKAYPEEVRLVYRHYPLVRTHDRARITAEAAEAAGAQGKFWEMHDLLFERQKEWIEAENVTETLVSYAGELGLDVERFRRDLEEGTFREKVEIQRQQAEMLGIPGTPFLLVNGRPWPRSLDFLLYSHLEAVVKLIELAPRQYEAPPPMVIDPKKAYTATLVTEKGEIVLQLFPQAAPQTVNNFVFLAREGWYDGVTFFRVIPGFVAQTGDPTDTGLGTPGYTIPDEITTTLKYDRPGRVGMANAGPNTNGSQFFITFRAVPELDGYYTLFGQVVKGMDVVEALQPRDPQQDPEAPPGDRILKVIIQEGP